MGGRLDAGGVAGCHIFDQQARLCDPHYVDDVLHPPAYTEAVQQ